MVWRGLDQLEFGGGGGVECMEKEGGKMRNVIQWEAEIYVQLLETMVLVVVPQARS